MYRLGSYCNQGFFQAVLDVYSSDTVYLDAIIADSSIKHSAQCLKIQQHSPADLANMKFYAKILRIQSADMQKFNQ